MDWLTKLADWWHYLVAAVALLLAVLGSGHAILYKRDTRSASLWVGFIWLAPLVGSVAYFMFGVNRIRRQAAELRDANRGKEICTVESDLRLCSAPHLTSLVHLVDQVVGKPLLPGNSVEPLINGDEAFPAMLEAIAHARDSITLASYIFDNDAAGHRFVEALAQAQARGVEIRVLVDDTGARYSWPSIVRPLKKHRIPVARFLPSLAPSRVLAINLRNHRKVMVVDGRIGFTGGMNIRAGNCLKDNPKHPVQDIHFRLRGPIVRQLQEVFIEDWEFTTQETLSDGKWLPELNPCGTVTARALPDGPDEDYDKLRLVIKGALATARHYVRIVTPYFLPDATLISALNLAALRGVRVDIVLTGDNNLPFVHWATVAHLWQMLERGCHFWLTPPPFDHSKIMVVDDCWSLIGSANWDPRSLRLNFELNVECYDEALAAKLNEIIDQKIRLARRITLEEVDGRNIPVRLRDGIARLLTPYL